MYSTVSKNCETSFNIVIQTITVDVYFGRWTVIKRSSCVGEHMRASLNQLLNKIFQNL